MSPLTVAARVCALRRYTTVRHIYNLAPRGPGGPPFRPRLPVWKSPLRPGKVQAYDEALKFIRQDSANLRAELKQIGTAYEAEKSKEQPDPELLAHYQEKIRILEVQSEINLPEVRIAFTLGKYPFRQPVYRHLAEQRWRKDGMLDLLMERIYQMHVVPDLLPELHPNVDVRIQFPNPASHRALSQRRAERAHFYKVEPGTFLPPEQTRYPPRVTCTVFHTDVRHYTMLLLDPDVPDEASSSFQTYLHWMQPNIPLVASHRNIKIIADHTPYIPPHPQQGTPYHRYVLLLLPHRNPTEILDIPVPQDHERLGFNLREFAARYGFSLGQGGGAHMWREVWDGSVSSIYRDVLHVPEPVFKRPRKPDPYADPKSQPRRPLLV